MIAVRLTNELIKFIFIYFKMTKKHAQFSDNKDVNIKIAAEYVFSQISW